MEKHYDDGTEPTVLPHFCNGPCRQGRDKCPCPEVCESPENGPFDTAFKVVAGMLGVAAASFVIGVLVAKFQ